MENPRQSHRFTRLLVLLLPLLIGACGEAPDETPPVERDVTVYRIEARDTPVVMSHVAKTESSRRVEIRSRVDGFLEKRLYREGSFVKAGQPLFQMDRKPFEAQLQAARAELAQQKARLETAKANLERIRPLARQNAVAQKELDDALGMWRTAAAAVEAARAKVVQAELNLGYTLITSPVTGISSFAIKREGAYIGIGTDSLLTYVAQLDPMWVEFSVSENELLRLRRLEEAGLLRSPPDSEYTVSIRLADGSRYPQQGHITFADAALNEETGTFLIRAELANPGLELRPGMFVRADIHGAVRPNAILIPQRAVQQSAQGSFVWVVNAEGRAERRPVEVGPWLGDKWFIDKGLEDGETVVVEGALRLQPGVPVHVVGADARAIGDS